MNKDFVKLRLRERNDGKKAVFLTYYYKGKRREESLRLYLVPELIREDKKKNKEVLAIAETVRARRMVELNENIFKLRTESPTAYLLEFFTEKMNERKTQASRDQWLNVYKKLSLFLKGRDVLLSDIDVSFVERFIKYLDKEAVCSVTRKGERLKANTKWVYYSKLRSVLNAAVKLKYITANPCSEVMTPRKEEVLRSFLTLEELQRLIAAPCINKAVKRCFLFSCLTGLRRSDIIKLKWSEVSNNNGFTRITFRQRKTANLQYLDINAQAAALLGERGENDDLVFPRMPKPVTANKDLRLWAKAAGLNKYISFHCARHTFATLMLTLGTDLFTVSKLLGHANIKTTQVYAKVLDAKRQEAVNKIPDLKI